MRSAIIAAALGLWAATTHAQTSPPISQRGFVEGRAVEFPQDAPNDTTNLIADLLAREEVFVRAARWLRFAAGVDLRANSHDQVEDEWRVDFNDRGVRRPRVAIRRLTATLTTRALTLDIGKQFIRWGRADILNPTDRFAPRDFLNVIDSDFLPVLGAHPSAQFGSETFEAVWVARLTPSRIPLLTQRWTVLPPEAAGVAIHDNGAVIPDRSQWGVRWRHAGARIEGSVSYFDGFNHLPNIDVRAGSIPSSVELTRVFPALRTYGGDVAIPTSSFTLKGEAAYFVSPSATTEEYVLYVVEIERQIGEWVLDGGYAGEVVTSTRPSLAFAPDRDMAKSIIGRASYTVDPRRTIAIESAVRQSGDGFYVKGEFSEAFGQYWRLTFTGVGVAGHEDDFLGQFHRNSHGSATLRFSF
jgi:hypothetical protein